MDIPADKLAKVYLKIRDKLAEIKAAYDKEYDALKAQQAVIEAELLNICKASGAESFRTTFGTVIKGTQTRYWTGDWDAMHKYVLANNAPQLLERRVAQGEMKTWIAEHPDAMPPGLNTDSKYVITVRRANSA